MLHFVKNITDAVKLFFKLNMMPLAAALAYYTLFSLPPILMIIIFLMQRFYGVENPEHFITSEIGQFEGKENAHHLVQSLSKLKIHTSAFQTYIIGIVLLILSATSVFSTLKAALHKIFNITYHHNIKQSIIKQLRDRFLAIGFITGIGGIFIVSLLLNLAINYIDSATIFGIHVKMLFFVDLFSHFLGLTCFFILMFKVLIDVKLAFGKMLFAAIFTSILFIIGKFFLGSYISSNKELAIYSNTGGAIALLLWTYYNSGIILLGGAFLKVICSGEKN